MACMERNRGSMTKATGAATLEVDPLAQPSEASDDCSPCHILTTTIWERMSQNHSARLLLNSWPTKNFQRCVIHQQVTIYKLNYRIPIVNRCYFLPMSSSVLSAGSFSRHSRTRSRPCRGSVRSMSSSSSSSSSESTGPSGRRVKSTSPTSLSVAYRKKSWSLITSCYKNYVLQSEWNKTIPSTKYYQELGNIVCCIKNKMILINKRFSAQNTGHHFTVWHLNRCLSQ